MQNFYKGKKVFITGHTGFKGAWLTQILTLMGADVKGYALKPNTEPALYNILNLDAKMQSVFADLRDEQTLNKELAAFRPQIVFHLAAQPLVRLSYAEPALTFQTNIMGTVNLLEAVRACDSVKSVVCITSDKCYQNNETGRAYREDDPMGGHDPYSASKGMMELLCASYRNSFLKLQGIQMATCRAGNVIGGGDWAKDRIVPDCALAVKNGKPIVLRSPKAVRPWQHVMEPLFAYMLIAKNMCEEQGKYDSAWNIGPKPSDIRTVEDLVKTFTQAWGQGSYEVQADTKLHEAKLLHLDITKAQTQLNWQPVYNFENAVKITAQWYKAFYEGKDAADLTIQQIQDYSENLWKTF